MKKLENIESLQKEREELRKREEQAFTPDLTDQSKISTIYNWFTSLGGEDVRVFIMIILLLYHPKSLVGGQMKKGLRKSISKVIGGDESGVSHKCKNVMFIYKNYKTFKDDVKHYYAEIILKLELSNHFL